MMDNPVYNDDYVKGSDLQQVIDQVNANEVFTDNMTITGNKSEAGMSLSVIDQYGGGGGGGGGGISFPFTMSLVKSDSDEQLVKISSGRVNVNETVYNIEENFVNIESSPIGTAYIYLKLSANWLSGIDFLGYPILTIKTGEDIVNTNFAQNAVQFPATDNGNYFYQIGTVEITEKEGERSYKINQIATTDSFFSSEVQNAFTLNRVFKAKTTDSETDASYDIYCNAGQAVLPEISVNTLTITEQIPIADSRFCYLKITAVQNAYLYFRNWNAEVVFSATALVNDTVTYYVQIGRAGFSMNQSYEGVFSSTGVLW